MCNHEFVKLNDVTVCKRCGLSFTFDGKVLFDRRLPDISKKKGERKSAKKRK